MKTQDYLNNILQKKHIVLEKSIYSTLNKILAKQIFSLPKN